MKVQNTRRVTEKIMQMMQIREVASMVDMIISNGIAEGSVVPADLELLRREAEKTQKDMPSFTVDELMLLLMVESIIGPQLQGKPRELDFFMNQLADECKVFDVEEFCQNPYIKNIHFTSQSKGDYELCYSSMLPYELGIYNVAKRINEFGIDIPRVSCFTEEFKFPAIVEKSTHTTWMSITPNEVYTMEKPIRSAKGKVLTLGCGMGYFAYMASLKEEVESVTIVEIEQDVIDLFEEYLLPQFENREKITIVKADAIEYLRNLEDGAFDYCFADIWAGIWDIVPYFAVKEIGRQFRKTKMEYWIEESFAILLASSVWLEIVESFSAAVGLPVPPMVEEMLTGLTRRKQRYIHELLKDEEITKPEQVEYYIDPKTVVSLINRTELIF